MSSIWLSCSFLPTLHPVRCFTDGEALPNITDICLYYAVWRYQVCRNVTFPFASQWGVVQNNFLRSTTTCKNKMCFLIGSELYGILRDFNSARTATCILRNILVTTMQISSIISLQKYKICPSADYLYDRLFFGNWYMLFLHFITSGQINLTVLKWGPSANVGGSDSKYCIKSWLKHMVNGVRGPITSFF